MVNASPEPFSNVILSTAEDVLSAGLLALAFTHPIVAGVVALALLGLAVWLLLLARRIIKRVFGRGVSRQP